MFLNVLISVFAVLKDAKKLIKFEKYFLVFNFLLQAVSGVFLADLNHVGFIDTCTKLGIYLGVFMTTEVMLIKKIKIFEGAVLRPQ